MKATIKIKEHLYTVNLSNPIDISIALRASEKNPEAWYLSPPTIKPVVLDNWVGSVQEGASVNFNTITFNPHAHGTHTECVGHISKEFHAISKTLDRFFFVAELISVAPELKGEDEVISEKQIKALLKNKKPEALIIRTLPNTKDKKQRQYSHTNWPYLDHKAAQFLREIGVEHLLIDLPSVDKEKDDGALLAHKAFWDYPKNPRLNATITEFIYVRNRVKDGSFILNLQVARFNNDAAPSRPVLYEIES
ncbi:cyclase family protein [Patiriisocius hiemis]|uniref:Cyclase family protein n=1 Tax=Patiriisocius hiemis TaxID=3075604 RepID=A0ABU2YDS6_9FLAO|nr:cyclase family protein [Constantimarinum sp. W242]MDT0556344.1 cyclase family protein [Constantimarinum sp. W242]